MLNLTRLHLGIAHESQFQGLGYSRNSSRQRLPWRSFESQHTRALAFDPRGARKRVSTSKANRRRRIGLIDATDNLAVAEHVKPRAGRPTNI
jgi:hypothetical protein